MTVGLSSIRLQYFLFAISIVVALGAAIALSATAAGAQTSPLAPPSSCTSSIEDLVLDVTIQDNRSIDQWAIRAIENDTDAYNFLGRTGSRSNVFVDELPVGEYTVAARAISNSGRSDWLVCGTVSVDEVPLTLPRACNVTDEGGRSVRVRFVEENPAVNLWAVRAIEADTGEFVFLGRTTSVVNNYEAPYPDGNWLVSVRSILGAERSDWTPCGLSQIPFDPPPPPPVAFDVSCSARLLAGGETIEARGAVFETDGFLNIEGIFPDIVFSAVNTDGDFVYFGRFDRNEAEFLEFDATLLDPGTWTVQARWLLDDGTRGDQVPCDTFTRTGDDAVLLECRVRHTGGAGAFVDVLDFNGDRFTIIELLALGDNGQLVLLDDTVVPATVTGFIRLDGYAIGESVDVFASPVGFDVAPQLCGTVVIDNN